MEVYPGVTTEGPEGASTRSDRRECDATSEVDRLAAEIVARIARGEDPDLEREAAGLSTEEEREELRALVEAARRASALFPRRLERGTRIAGRYLVLDEIGSGGMGRVFAAVDERLSRRVAIKVLASPLTRASEQEALFERESRLLASLSHPGIVDVHEAGRDGDWSYIVMDLVEGTGLDEVLERARESLRAGARLDGTLLERAIGRPAREGAIRLIEPDSWWRSVARITAELARTIEAAHGAGVVHRDLKPGNVILEGGGRPVVLDFGLGGRTDALVEGAVTRGLYGSVAYLAPEQACTHRVGNDPRTDVYQLGLCLYELLTLRRAFEGDAIAEVLQRVLLGVFPRPREVRRDVPRDLDRIALTAMDLDPARRYQTARAFREDLERWLEGLSPRIARTSSLHRASRAVRWGMRRHPLAVAAGALAIAAGLTAWTMLSRPAPSLDIVGGLVVEPQRRALVPVEDGDVIAPDDLLCVDVEVQDRAFLYTFSLYRETEGGPLLASPCAPWPLDQALAALRGGELPEREDWGLELGSGRHAVFVAVADGANTEEGLLVLASPAAEARLESWLESADAKARAEGRLAFEALRDLFPAGTTRGEGLAGLSESRRRRLADHLEGVSVNDLLAERTPVKQERLLLRVRRGGGD